jgi:serine/threonine protein kinase
LKVIPFTADGPLPTEIPALREIEKAFPSDWYGFANVVIRHPTNRRHEREVDLIVVTHDRILLVDLKHWNGRLELVDGYWHQEGERRDKSPVSKMRDNVFLLLKVFEAESFKLGKPWVEGLVVLTHPACDASQLGADKQAVLRLGDFLKLGDPKHYRTTFPRGTPHTQNPLNTGPNKDIVTKFFRPGRVFEPRKTRFQGYEAVGAPEFTSTLYDEYAARDVEDANYTALLRVWDFTQDEEFQIGPERKALVERERAVLGYLTDRDPDLASATLRPRARDPEFGPRYWELFDRDKNLQRLSRFVNDKGADLDIGAKIDLAKLLSGHVAALHRADIAHRDLGGHSIWVDHTRLRVALSSFGAARFPERTSIGSHRTKLLGANLRLPEDAGIAESGSAYQQDVFLLGVAVWSVLSTEPLPMTSDVPDWGELQPEGADHLSPTLLAWFAKCLDWDPSQRFATAVEAHDALLKALAARNSSSHGAMDLSPYEAEVDPTLDYPPKEMMARGRCRIYTTEHQGETLLVKNWPERAIGDRNKNAARLIEFFGRAERLRGAGSSRLPRVHRTCLCHDGLFLLQDYLNGAVLESADVSNWGANEYRRFFIELIDGVSEAHDLGVPHGDLSPQNILVATTDQGPAPRIIDFLDFSTEAAGDRVTLAYAPHENSSDPYARDRFAVAAIAQEVARKVTGLASSDIAALDAAFEACRDQAAPWATLKPLIDVLKRSPSDAEASGLVVRLGFPRCASEGQVLPDDKVFHVVLNSERDEISFVGFDFQVILRIDKTTRTVKEVRASEAKTQTLGWAARHKAFSFEGSLELYRSKQVAHSGLEALFEREEIASWFGQPEPNDHAEITAESPAQAASNPPKPQRFPIAKFWEAQIQAEEDTRPSVMLVDDLFYDPLHEVLVVPHDSDSALEVVSDGDVVFFNGTRIGTVAGEHSRPGHLALRPAGGKRQIKTGDVLTVQPQQNAESLKRRAMAVRRILQGRSPIRNLVEYFDPASKAHPIEVAQPASVAELDIYGFNPDQVEAFKTLWSQGPVGLLQGPPGTGKTKFISGFVHYALTKGQLRNVLLVSQSHEAVNNAAERIQSMMRDAGQSLDLLRIGSNIDKISDPLRRSHIDAIQDLYLNRFEVEGKARLSMIAKRLGLPRAFADDMYEMDAGPAEVARRIIHLRKLEVSGDDQTVVEQRIGALEDALRGQLDRFGVNNDAEPFEVVDLMTEHLQDVHNIRDLEAVSRLRAVQETAREWTRTLRTKSRTLEEFLASSRRLVCGTCVGIGNPKLRVAEKTFDLVVIDEAARATSSELAVAMQSAQRVLLVGDHKQLPPNIEQEIVKQLALRTGITDRLDLVRSDFERVFGSPYGRQTSAALKRQYRMAPKIGKLISDVFYPEVGLITERGEPSPHYKSLPFPFDDEYAWVDTGGRQGPGEVKRGTSFVNPAEAQTIIRLLESLARSGEFLQPALADLKDGEPLVGVICMYAQQKNLVQDLLAMSTVPIELRSRIKVDTVDSYQGKENRLVIVSLVRSNPRAQIGFLEKENRINVALSRAMDRLIIVGATAMFRSSESKLAEVLTRMEASGRVAAEIARQSEAA